MANEAAQLYLDLLKRCIMGLVYEDQPLRNIVYEPFSINAPYTGPYSTFDREKRLNGHEWPSQAHTMLSMHRLNNIQSLVTDILEKQIPGDLIETGVWRGGATIFMRGILKAYNCNDRTVWVADSFQGFPKNEEEGLLGETESPGLPQDQHGPPPKPIQDILDLLWKGTAYDDVRQHFEQYGLLDDQVKFLKGWFCHTLHQAPIDNLALLRLDGDLYDSTYDALEALYPKVSQGGYVIVDDYATFEECYNAVHDYLESIGAEVTMQPIDEDSVFWQKL
ncbi:MAG: TylF/MycF family methyltransferase [Chloroflexi bacterium]|nr:TylF/MycF family methyltransferase [Chloroflexota bacterium]